MHEIRSILLIENCKKTNLDNPIENEYLNINILLLISITNITKLLYE